MHKCLYKMETIYRINYVLFSLLGTWASIKYWFMIGDKYEEELVLEEYKKVPNYLNTCIHYFTSIFGVRIK